MISLAVSNFPFLVFGDTCLVESNQLSLSAFGLCWNNTASSMATWWGITVHYILDEKGALIDTVKRPVLRGAGQAHQEHHRSSERDDVPDLQPHIEMDHSRQRSRISGARLAAEVHLSTSRGVKELKAFYSENSTVSSVGRTIHQHW